MAKRGVGVVTRHIPSWYSREMYGGRHSQTGAVGNITYVELYNSSSRGGLIYVWAIDIGPQNIDELIPEWYYGKHQTSSGGQSPLRSDGPAGYGVIGGWNNSTCIGVEIGDFLSLANTGQQWPHDWAMAVITAGYSFAVHSAAGNNAVDVGLWWQESPEY